MPRYVDVVVHLTDGGKRPKKRVLLDSTAMEGWLLIIEESGNYSMIPDGSIFYIDVEV